MAKIEVASLSPVATKTFDNVPSFSPDSDVKESKTYDIADQIHIKLQTEPRK